MYYSEKGNEYIIANRKGKEDPKSVLRKEEADEKVQTTYKLGTIRLTFSTSVLLYCTNK